MSIFQWFSRARRLLLGALSLACLAVPTLAAAADNALNFDGTDDRVVMSVPSELQAPAAGDFTIAVWLNPTAATTQRVLFAQQSSGQFVSILLSGANQVYAYVASGGSTFSAATTTSLPVDAWSHLTVVWRASASTVALYVNGAPATTIAGGTSSTGTDGVMTLGSRTDGAQPLHGSLDRLLIYGSALADADILAAATSCQVPAGAAHVYQFDQGVAGADNAGETTLADGAGANPGSLLNFALAGAASNWVATGATPVCASAPPPTPAVTVAVPALQTWAVAVLGLLLAGMAVARRRKPV